MDTKENGNHSATDAVENVVSITESEIFFLKSESVSKVILFVEW